MTVQSAALDQLSSLFPAATSPQKTGNKGELGQEQFLKLLITQLKNQDPLNPMESVEFTSQLAQFSSLEQLFSVGDDLEAIKTSLQSQEGDQLVQYIGKKVTSEGSNMTVEGGESGTATFRLEDDAEVWVSIYTADGIPVRKLSMGQQKKGDCRVPWDGRDESGETVKDGDYFFQVQAQDAKGASVSCLTYAAGEVTGVRHENGESFLLIGNRRISPEKIIEISKL